MMIVADFWKGIALGFAAGVAALSVARARAQQQPIPIGGGRYSRALENDLFSESDLELRLRQEAAEGRGLPARFSTWNS